VIALADQLRQDIRHAVRGLRRTPGFTLVVALTLALGIGTNTAIFSVVDQLLLRPLPYPDGDQIVRVHEQNNARGTHSDVNPGNWLDWQRQSQTLAAQAAWDPAAATLTGIGEPERLQALLVSHEFFPLLGVAPLVGRTIAPDDDRPDAPRVVVLSHALWQRRFNADPAVVGRIIRLNEEPNEVIGVMPPGFLFLFQETDFWTAFRLDRNAQWRDIAGRFMSVVARMKPGVTLADAEGEMVTIATGLQTVHPRQQNMSVDLVPLRDELVGDVQGALLVLYGAVVLLLAIACLNVANLRLARARSRRREIAVRSSIGAGRIALVRQFVVESVVLAAIGGALGLLFARWSLNGLLALAPPDVVPVTELRLDRRILLYAVGVSVVTGIVVGLVPAIATLRRSLADTLRVSSSTITHASRMRQALVVGQVAMTVVLLSGAGLLMRTVAELTVVDPGFDRRDLLTMQLDLPNGRYDETRTVEFYRQLRERVRQLPGVESAAAAVTRPVVGPPIGRTGVQVLGQPELPATAQPSAATRVVTPDYFRTLGIPVVAGREFTEADQTPDAGLSFIVNEAFVSQILQGQDPLTVMMTFGMQEENPYAPIIGVVGDVADGSVSAPAQPTVFYNQRQIPIDAMVLFLRAPGAPGVARAAIDAIHELDPNLAIANVQTMDTALGESLGRERLIALVSTMFGLSGLVLASLGLYGLLAFIVAERTKEIGLRIALGARLGELLRGVLGGGLFLVLVGAIIGIAAAAAVSRSIAFLFYGVTPYDPLTYAAVLALLALVAMVATLVPARRAATVNPVVALRAD
jgi:putative ABC transport system permease protein